MQMLDVRADNPNAVVEVLGLDDPLSNGYLHALSPDGSPVRVDFSAYVTPLVELSFDFALDQGAVLQAYVNDLLIHEWLGQGLADPGLGQHADVAIDMAALSLAEEWVTFTLTFKGSGDPHLYLDDLVLANVPEPCTLLLTAGGLAFLLGGARATRRSAKTPSDLKRGPKPS
jgi:hypothetical protein